MIHVEESLVEKQGLTFSEDRYAAWSDSSVKQQHREQVLSHIFKCHTRRFRMRYFGLPGARWHAERIIESEWGSANFVGCENRYGTIEKGLPWMPGKNPVFHQEEMRNGHIDTFATNMARMLHFDVFDLLRLTGHFKRSNRHKLRFARRYKMMTCAWIDSWSPVGSRLHDAMVYLGSFIDRRLEQAPIAVTFLIGRDNDLSGLCDSINDPLERRARIISNALSKSKWRSFVIDDAWSHESKGGARNMGTVVGRLVRKAGE